MTDQIQDPQSLPEQETIQIVESPPSFPGEFIAPFKVPENAVSVPEHTYQAPDPGAFTPQELNAGAKANRAAAYKETDALFFKAQRGEVTMQEWLDAVQAVKDRFPYVPE